MAKDKGWNFLFGPQKNTVHFPIAKETKAASIAAY